MQTLAAPEYPLPVKDNAVALPTVESVAAQDCYTILPCILGFFFFWFAMYLVKEQNGFRALS